MMTSQLALPNSWIGVIKRDIGADYRIRIASTTNGAYIDASDSNFTIQ